MLVLIFIVSCSDIVASYYVEMNKLCDCGTHKPVLYKQEVGC